MKKFLVIFLSLIIILLFTVSSYAETYEVDQFTGEIIGSVDGTNVSTNTVRISNTCVYNKSSKQYVFTLSSSSDSTVTINVYDGEYSTKEVEIYVGNGVDISVYRDGKVQKETGEKFYALDTQGKYTIINTGSDSQVLTFTILSSKTGLVNSYVVPSVYRVTKVTLDGSNKSFSGNSISLEEEGKYKIYYVGSKTDTSKTLEVTIDHTAPVLEINGVTDGVANGPVTFGDTENGSTLVVKRDGNEVTFFETLKTAGDYEVIYTDDSGNESVYNFTIKLYIDIKAEFVIIFFVVLAIAIVSYMVYTRKNMRTY